MTSTCKLHGYTDGSATDAVQDAGARSLIYLPNGQTLEAASATGKYCTNYDAKVKSLEQGAHAVIDQTDTNSENLLFLTDSRSVLDSQAGHGEHNNNLRSKLYSMILQWISAHYGIKGNEHDDRLATTHIISSHDTHHLFTRHTSSLQLHPHTHHIVAPGFVDRPRRSDCTAGQMDGEAGWWTTSGNIGLPPLARVMGVVRQQHRLAKQGANMEQEKPTITLKQKKKIVKNRVEQVRLH